MTREQHAVYVIKESIINKDVLEIGCGSAKFSLRAAESAKSVTCIDLTDEKLHEDIQNLILLFFIIQYIIWILYFMKL